MTLKGCASQACAACKYQRRKCTPGCLLAPYFPADKPHMFRNVHRLFGVSNIIKILKSLDPSQQPEAMTSIIYQAKLRDMFPVHGCCQVIDLCLAQIRQVKEELDAVYAQLEMCRQHFHQVASGTESIPSQLDLGMALPLQNGNPETLNIDACGGGALLLANNVGLIGGTQQLQSSYSSGASCSMYNNNYSSNNSSNSCMDGKDVSPLWINNQNQLQYGSSSDNISSTCSVVPNHQLVDNSSSAPLANMIQHDFVPDYDELQPFFDTFDDDRQSFVQSKEPCESSSGSSLKDTMQSMEHVSENELKTAAACFSLTSVN